MQQPPEEVVCPHCSLYTPKWRGICIHCDRPFTEPPKDKGERLPAKKGKLNLTKFNKLS